ncbi:MAG: YgjV family protein [Clostridia bacterium]|nr:YgjV family protein [Clostridia bacterium]
MTEIEIVAQALGIVGLVIIVLSYQFKSNRNFFLAQGTGSLFFFANFLLIGAYGGALFNLTNLFRGLLLLKNPTRKWKLVLIELAYTGCLVFSIIVSPSLPQILLVLAPYTALVTMSVLMVRAKPVPIRVFQIAWMSPSWIIHNIFNFSLGGLICESLNMVSSAVFLFRLKKETHAKKE